MAEALPFEKRAQKGEPAWEIAYLFPYQGHWSEEEYLALETNHLVEFADGYIEVLPMNTMAHQLIVAFLYRALLSFVEENKLGRVLFAPLPVRLWLGKYRELDLIFLSSSRLESLRGDYPTGADMVMEVVSRSREDRERDLVVKRQEYAEADIAEYWIVDPEKEQIVVLELRGNEYSEHGVYSSEDRATSALLDGFVVDVAAVLEAAGNNN